MNTVRLGLMAVLAIIVGTVIALVVSVQPQAHPVGYYKPMKGTVLGNVRSGTYESALGDLPLQNPVRFDLGFGEPVPWLNNTPSPGVEFLVLENEIIRANYDGEVKFVRSDRAWRTTHIDIDNGEIDGHTYRTVFEYVGNIRVDSGDFVKRGQEIGQGFRGRGSLYFEIQKDGVPVDPIKPA